MSTVPPSPLPHRCPTTPTTPLSRSCQASCTDRARSCRSRCSTGGRARSSACRPARGRWPRCRCGTRTRQCASPAGWTPPAPPAGAGRRAPRPGASAQPCRPGPAASGGATRSGNRDPGGSAGTQVNILQTQQDAYTVLSTARS